MNNVFERIKIIPHWFVIEQVREKVIKIDFDVFVNTGGINFVEHIPFLVGANE